ncbi:MAG: hypothetical protein B7733_07175 [Myxococcales bacterium FL481]|nr:MAG: hypothetical protein B7733_07175 [Myxococcales bacterium FL481]
MLKARTFRTITTAVNVFEQIPMADLFPPGRAQGHDCFPLGEVIQDACWDAAARLEDGAMAPDVQLDRSLPSYATGDAFGLRQLVSDAVAGAARTRETNEVAVRVELASFDREVRQAQLNLHVRDAGEVLPGRVCLHVHTVDDEAGRAHSPRARGRQASVLVVDARRRDARRTAMIVFGMGHRVQMVVSVAAAIRGLRHRRFDLLLVDEATPDVARLVASAGTVAERPAIIGLRGEGRGLRLLPEVDGWLPKPVAPDLLHPAIVSACGGRAEDATTYLRVA